MSPGLFCFFPKGNCPLDLLEKFDFSGFYFCMILVTLSCYSCSGSQIERTRDHSLGLKWNFGLALGVHQVNCFFLLG